MATNRQELRPAAVDHLAALASRFHPHAAPVWSWDTKTWSWVGPDGRHEVLGRDWGSAHLSLDRLGRELRCAHGAPLVGGPCLACRAEISGQLGERAAA